MTRLKSVSKLNKPGLEVTTFKLVGKWTFEQFVDANVEVDEWLQTKPGFQFRKMCLRDDGYVVDIVGWRTEKEGKLAGGNIMVELPESIVHAMIDQRTVSWNVMTIAHSVDLKIDSGEKCESQKMRTK